MTAEELERHLQAVHGIHVRPKKQQTKKKSAAPVSNKPVDPSQERMKEAGGVTDRAAQDFTAISSESSLSDLKGLDETGPKRKALAQVSTNTTVKLRKK